MGWKYKKIDIFEAVEIVKASPNEFVTQDVKIRNCVRAEDASEAINQVLRALWLARAERAKLLVQLDMDGHWDYIVSQETQGKTPKAELDRWFAGWDYAERKCREKAKEFE